MLGFFIDGVNVGGLDNLARIHDVYLITEFRYNAKIMRYEKEGHGQVLFQSLDQVYDLSLNGNV